MPAKRITVNLAPADLPKEGSHYDLPIALGIMAARGHGLICPHASGPEAAWAGQDIDVLAPWSLIQLANHFKGTQVMARPRPAVHAQASAQPDLRDIKGQESANAHSKLPSPEATIFC